MIFSGSLGRESGTGKEEGEDVVGADAEVDTQQVQEAVDGEAGARQQGECQGELADDEGLAQAMAACSDAGAVAFFESFAGIDARGVPGGRAAEEKTGERGGDEGEEQDGKVEVEIGFIGQRAARHDGHEGPEAWRSRRRCRGGLRRRRAVGFR